MSGEMTVTDETPATSTDAAPRRWAPAEFPALAGILLVASILRLFQLGHSSLWYDEVVTMRLARADGPAAMLRLLRQIDATRAPLHPLILQWWVSAFGASDFSGRSLSALCGILTVAAVYWVGREAFDAKTGLWAAWLCGLSPLLVYYSREVRMYAWLALVTCLGWGLLFSHVRPQVLEGRAVWTLADRDRILASAGFVDGGLARFRVAREPPGVRDLVEAMAAHSRGGRACGLAVGGQLLRPRSGIDGRNPSASVLVRNADRFHRRQFRDVARLPSVDRVRLVPN